MLYSGILILQLAIIAILLPKQRKTRPFLFQTALCYLIPTIALMAFLGESWWARYCAYFYFTSCLALLLLLLPGGTDSSASQIVQKALSVLFILLLAANTAFFALYNTKVIVEKTASENKHIAKLEKAARSGKRIVLGYKTEPGAVYALTDRDIPFEFIGPAPEDFKNKASSDSPLDQKRTRLPSRCVQRRTAQCRVSCEVRSGIHFVLSYFVSRIRQ